MNLKIIYVLAFLLCCIPTASCTMYTYTEADDGLGVFSKSLRWGDSDVLRYIPTTAVYYNWSTYSSGGTGIQVAAISGTAIYYYGNDYGCGARCSYYRTGGGIHMHQASNYEVTTGNPYLHVTLIVSAAPLIEYTISGDSLCIENVSLYIYDGSSYILTNYDTGDGYSFPIYNGYSYKLIFSDTHLYEFLVDGENIVYDRDGCIYTYYNFLESCNNLIPDSEGFYIEKVGATVYAANNFHTSDGTFEISNSPADNIYFSANLFYGRQGWYLDPILNDTTYDLINPIVEWGVKVIVQNESTGELIDGAMVRVEQSCYCTDEYSTRQKLTTGGMVTFTDMALQDASLFVMASGYKPISENNTGYNVFLSGRTNFSSKTWVVKLANSESDNTSSWYETGYKTDIFFKDINGNRTSQIRDTDAEVYLYYENNNSNEEEMTLKFQSSSTHTHFIDEQSWTISHDDIGHKVIDNSYFTPYTYAYRAVIYNSTIHGWNITIPLTVRNTTKEETLHYENLTTNLGFMYESDGKIDYREDMKIMSHAVSNNETLMTIDLELWKDGEILSYVNLTETDYANADFPYYYVYDPTFDYVSGSNYTIKMFGFDRTLLEIRYIECITDTITRKNKLTITVKDKFGANINNAYVFLDGYGSLPTGDIYYASYEGLDNGYYRFKATKPNYEGSGWSDVTLTDSDQIVTYVLIASSDADASASQPVKGTDVEMKSLYLTMMFFLLCFILFGGFMYVIK